MDIIDLRTEPHHLEMLAEWHHKEWAHLNPGQTLQDRINDMQAYLQEPLIPTTLMAKEGSCLLGSAAVVDNDMETHPQWRPWLASVFVAPEYRGRGVGTALVKSIMDLVRYQCESLFLFTEDQQAFYGRLGWHTLGCEEYRGEQVAVMKARLQ